MHCPICGFDDPMGPVKDDNPRESLACPRCNGTSRNRAVARAILVALRIKWPRHLTSSADRIYEIGRSAISAHIEGYWEYTCSELRPRKGCVVQDLEALTFPDDSFQVVICSDVLEHVRLYRRALAEMARVLAPGGHLILTVPPSPRPNHHHPYCIVGKVPEKDIWVLNPPVHKDPLDPRGCRVYRTFGSKLLIRQLAEANLEARLEPPNLPEYGIVNCSVFVAEKTAMEDPE